MQISWYRYFVAIPQFIRKSKKKKKNKYTSTVISSNDGGFNLWKNSIDPKCSFFFFFFLEKHIRAFHGRNEKVKWREKREKKGARIKLNAFTLSDLRVIDGHSSRERGPFRSRTGRVTLRFASRFASRLYKHSPNDNCYRVENTPRSFRKNAIEPGMGGGRDKITVNPLNCRTGPKRESFVICHH